MKLLERLSFFLQFFFVCFSMYKIFCELCECSRNVLFLFMFFLQNLKRVFEDNPNYIHAFLT